MSNPISSASATSRNVTLRDVAVLVGVSVQCASKVLNGGDSSVRVSPDTRKRIEEGAEELGYRRNHSARSIRMGNTKMLGWVGGDLSQEHVGKMLSGAIQAVEAHGYTLKIFSIGPEQNGKRDIQRISEMRLDGVLGLHMAVATQNELDAEARRYGYPLVLLDERSTRLDVPQIVSDDENGIAMAIAHLVELGHQRIAFISAEQDPTQITRNREQAFAKSLAEHGLALPDNYIQHGSFNLQEPSTRAAGVLLDLPEQKRPTAILCSGDYIALATLKVASARGIAVPTQLSLVGFANMGVLDYVSPRLSTIEQPFAAIGQCAVETLMQLIEPDENSPTQTAKTGRIMLPTRFIVGESTARSP